MEEEKEDGDEDEADDEGNEEEGDTATGSFSLEGNKHSLLSFLPHKSLLIIFHVPSLKSSFFVRPSRMT